jgi:hypothetical protein
VISSKVRLDAYAVTRTTVVIVVVQMIDLTTMWRLVLGHTTNAEQFVAHD